VIDLASLFWFTVDGAAIVGFGLMLRYLLRSSDGTSLPDVFGGYADPPWPRGVQEEEPVRWNLAALGQRNPDLTRTEPDRSYSPGRGFGPRQACQPRA
jgi:hypothetical protein